MAHKFIQDYFAQSAESAQNLMKADDVRKAVEQAVDWIVDSYKNGGKLFIAGNGGSAADAQHISAEMVGKLDKDRTPLPAYAMSVDTSYLTAVGNDYGYDHIFSRQVMGLMGPKDIFWGITTSGNSSNILKALEACRKVGAKSILMTGKDGGKAKQQGLADLYLIAPGAHTALIQQGHMIMYHAICFSIEKALIDCGHIKYL